MLKPFRIFSWRRPFLPDLKLFMEKRGPACLASSLVIVPHQRPWRYFADMFLQDKKFAVLPRMMPFSEAVEVWRANSGEPASHIANQLDQAALLRQCVNELAQTDSALSARFSRMDMAAFLPWGLRLASLLEEMFAHGIESRDLANLEGEVAPPAASLLSALGRISARWRALLAEKGWTTPGLDNYLASRQAEKIPPLLMPAAERPVYIAGFSSLNGAENALFYSLWQAGAEICIHADPALVHGKDFHWSCSVFTEWTRRWQAKYELALPETGESREPSESLFFAGYDCHSQLLELHEILGKKPDGMSTAIILAQPSLLMPVLHHLPQKDVNISMGYPMDRSPLGSMLEELFALQEKMAPDGLYYWKNFLRVIRQPYLEMLEIKNGNSESGNLRSVFRMLGNLVRNGGKLVDPAALLASCAANLTADEADLLKRCLDLIIDRFSKIKTTRQLGLMLEDLCHFLVENGGDIWQRFPLDAEIMARLLNKVIPELKDNALADEEFSKPILHGIARRLLERERVPFEADPLVGIQVMGMLESRLLHFDRILILDATDDILPGQLPQDPLLPDSLRPLLGLPDARSRERVSAYNLYRLCAGAKEKYFFWQEGISDSELFDGKKTRSRFVEQMIWAEEQKLGKILKPGAEPLRVARAAIHMKKKEIPAIERGPAINEALSKFLQRAISPSRLDAYLQCPLRFAYANILKIQKADEVNEGEDASFIGSCVHAVLYDMYQPFLNRDVRPGDITFQDIERCFQSQLAALDAENALPADSYLMFELAAPHRLNKFLQNQPKLSHVLALEHQLAADIAICGSRFKFAGRVDRIDRRDGKLVILDYKTGRIKKYDQELWLDAPFFDRLNACCEDAAIFAQSGQDCFEELRQRLPSVQLPCYLTMLKESGMGEIGNAALVELYDSCREISIFQEMDENSAQLAIDNCQIALAFVIRHLLSGESFFACPEAACAWCDYSSLCKA